MKLVFTAPIEEDFEVVLIDGGRCRITFYENGTAAIREDNAGDGEQRTEYVYDAYYIERPYYPMISTDIANNKAAWLSAAKAEDERRTPVDEYQLRADVDYLNIVTGASSPYGIQTLALDDSEPKSDKDVLDLAYKYYPARWDKGRLLALLAMGKLIQSDFDKIVGNDVAE